MKILQNHTIKEQIILDFLNEIKSKIDTLTSDISELTSTKKKLSNALDIAKVQVAEIFL